MIWLKLKKAELRKMEISQMRSPTEKNRAPENQNLPNAEPGNKETGTAKRKYLKCGASHKREGGQAPDKKKKVNRSDRQWRERRSAGLF